MVEDTRPRRSRPVRPVTPPPLGSLPQGPMPQGPMPQGPMPQEPPPLEAPLQPVNWRPVPEERDRAGRRCPSIVAMVLVAVLVLVVAGVTTQRLRPGRPASAPAALLTPRPALPAASPTPAPGGVVVPTQPSGVATESTVRPVHDGAAEGVKLAVFTSTSPQQVVSFGRWLGRGVDYAVDFSSRDTWREISDPSYMLDTWRGSGYRMVFTVGLLPNDQPATIDAGARGAYDTYYRQLARHLMAAGQPNAILRLGWEFNLGSSRWSTPDSKAFIAYWRHVVTAMRSVPGQRFRFDWNINVGETTYDATDYYPGARYVDYVGVDVYDVSWTPDTYPYPPSCSASCRLVRQKIVWDRLLNGDLGLLYWSNFAQFEGKPLSLPEWGMWRRPDGHGGGDDPYFIEQMFAFIDDPTNNVAYQGYFDTDSSDGLHSLATLTGAGTAFRELFH